VRREVLAEAIAGEGHVRVLPFQAGAFGTVADDDLAAAPRHMEECVDVLFDCDSAHVGGDRARQRQKVLRIRLEDVGVHAAAPTRQVLEALHRQIPANRGGAHHAAHRRAVKPAQRAIRGLERNREPRLEILRKLGVIGGCEAHAPIDAKTPRAQSQRAFGRDVQGLRRE